MEADDATIEPLQTSPLLAKSVNALAADLWGRLRDNQGNQAFSPASITLALAMTQIGARGETALQMSRILHSQQNAEKFQAAAGQLVQSISAPEKRAYTLRVANKLFGEKSYSFETPFLATTRERFGAELEPLDFRTAPDPSRLKINGWVAERTNNRIRDLLPLPSIDVETRLVLVNALYFYGAWVDQFREEATRPQPFRLTSSRSRDVAMMHRSGIYPYARADGVRLLGMPYRGGDVMMTIVLPDKVGRLAAVERGLTAKRLDSWLSAAADSRHVSVSLPRFTIDPASSLALKTELEALGMQLAFVRGQADFTGIANPENPVDRLYIGEVYHRAFVAVDENGTEAAAATAVASLRAGGVPGASVEFNADHPFLFIIHTRVNPTILFLGRVADPR